MTSIPTSSQSSYTTFGRMMTRKEFKESEKADNNGRKRMLTSVIQYRNSSLGKPLM